MKEETAEKFFEADIGMLISAASRLNERMRSLATTYLGGCISLGTVVIAVANLVAQKAADLSELYQSNRILLGILGCFLYAIGVMRLLSFCRARKHYIKIINTFNDLRRESSDLLGVSGDYADLWTDKMVETWESVAS